jgi:AraC-like DNA-binding protein
LNAFLYISAGFAAVLAAYLATTTGQPKTSLRLLAAAMLALVSLNLLTLLGMHTPGSPILLIRPALAVALPALLYLHLSCATRREQTLRYADSIHLVGPAIASAMGLTPNPGQWLDLAIVLPNLVYLGLIGWDARQRTASFSHLGAALAALLDRWRLAVAVFLAFVATFDILVSVALKQTERSAPAPWVFGAIGLLLTFVLAYLLVSSLHRKGPLMWAGSRPRKPEPEYETLIKHLEEQMLSSRVFLDPNLSLQRFSRKVGITPREVSASINGHRNCNYNQWLNGFRIKEAQQLLRENRGQSITEVMFASGFQNKSTFNASFLAACGESPSAWRSRLGVDDSVK